MASIAQWQQALAGITAQVPAPTRHEQVTVAAAVGRVLAQACPGTDALPAGTLLKWTHLPPVVAAGWRTLAVYPRLRAGIVTMSDPVVDEAPAALAQASGIAWRPDEMGEAPAGSLAYMAFEDWLR